MDPEMAAMMGFGDFGKKKIAGKAKVDVDKLDKTKRAGAAGPAPSASSIKAEAEQPEAGPSTSAQLVDEQPVASSSSAAASAAPRPASPAQDSDDDDDDFSEPEEETDFLPITHEISWKDHGKPISALALDPSGARVATGSHDYDVKLYDFGGMSGGEGGYKPFSSFEPAGSYHIHDVAYSPSGEQILVVAGNTQAQVYSRDGDPADGRGTAYMKGDPYLRDMKHTNGHVADLTAGCWNPKNGSEFITSSNDSTVRIWDVENKRKQKTVIVVKSKERGTRTKITTCAFSPDGKHIGAAGLDGTLHVWATNSNFARPNMTKEGAHAKDTETSSMCFSIDGRMVASRGGDDTVKLWDIRNFRQPVYEAKGLVNLYADTNIIFSPDDRHLLTGIGKAPGSEKKSGELVVLSKEGLEEERRIDVGEGSVVRVQWHSRINQIVTGSSTGRINVLYNPRGSSHGALLPLSKMGRTAPRHIDSIQDSHLPPVIITPHALPMFRDDDRAGGGKRKRERERNDPVKTMKPTEPISGPGKGGRVGASATQHLLRGVIKDNSRAEDPREALLKYADVAETNPVWAGGWANQPKIFRTVEEEVGMSVQEQAAATEARLKAEKDARRHQT